MSKCKLYEESLDMYVIYHGTSLIYANAVHFFCDKTRVPLMDL